MSRDSLRPHVEKEILEREVSHVAAAPSRLAGSLSAFNPNSLDDAQELQTLTLHPLAVGGAGEHDDHPHAMCPGPAKPRKLFLMMMMSKM
eukprot:TRINITY_DN72499_c0_g1_i1.p1 TRINITY_DN72499_c0_g1~~TRINITY_DN72499_c0_g1_i1.p1  ORF type:complete len:101 (-),score=5.87 TRINITY_DN72499_c0_g1_i1:119-388(-)